MPRKVVTYDAGTWDVDGGAPSSLPKAVSDAELGSGTPTSAKFLRGDRTWATPSTSGGVDSLSKSGDTQLTGDVTLSEGSNITLTEVGNDIEIASTASGGSTELDYVEYNAGDITVNGSSGSPNTILTGNSVAYDGSTRVKIEFYTAGVFAGSAALIVELWEDSSAIERLVQTNSTLGAPGYGCVFRTPSNASHTYYIKAWKNGGTDGAIAAASTFAPIFLRITTA